MPKSRFIKIILTLVIVLVVGVGWKILNSDRLTTTEAFWVVDPVTQGGKKLPGTERVDGAFSVSPDGRWILYFVHTPIMFDTPTVLYDVKKQERYEIVLSPRAKELSAEGYGPDGSGCWDPDENKVYLTGGPLFVLDPQSDARQLEVIEDFEESKWRYYDDCITPSDAATYIRVNQRSPQEIHLVDAGNPQRILARHKAAILMRHINIEGYWDTSRREWVEYLSYSPDFKRVAYVVEGSILFGN
jgi:hypothetical protein